MTTPILLVADSTPGERVREHLAEYAPVTMVTPRDYRGVPYGTEWVLVMNSGRRGSQIFEDARKASAMPLSIATGWSHVQLKLDRAGFFKRMAAPAKADPGKPDTGLKQRPFAALAALAPDLSVADSLLAEGMMDRTRRVITAALDNVEAAAAKAVAEANEATEALDALPEPEPAPVPERQGARGDADYMRAMTRVRVERSLRKQAVLRDLFTRNPDAHIDDALATLRAMEPEGTAVNGDVARTIRAEVRAAKGLPPHPPKARPRRSREAPSAPAVQSPPPPPTPAPPSGPTLPPDVEAAARLLKDALEASAGVLDFTLTFRQGRKVRVDWQPLHTASLEL